MIEKEAIIKPFDKQDEFAKAFWSKKYSYMLYGGAIRGGKTYVALAMVYSLCKVFPGSRWALVRKDLPTIRRNLLPTFEKFKPDFVGPVNRSTWVADCANGSRIIFFPESIDRDPELNRWRGLEVNGFVLEEANELSESSFNKAIERAGTWVLPGGKKQPDPIIFLTCNPALGWVKNTFYNPWKMGTLEAPYYYLPARADDNPHVPQAVRDSWKNLPEKDYRRFVEGDWDVSDDPDQLIKFEWVSNAYSVEPAVGRHKMGIDVARFGDDNTTFAYMRGNELYEIEEFSGLPVDKVSNYAQARIAERGIGADQVGVDVVGLGAGVADNLRGAGYDVRDIISGAKAVEIDTEEEEETLYKFKTLRSQMWWHYRERLRKGEIAITIRHQKLVDDLLAVKYKISADREIQIEGKDEIKKRLGRSTDYGDSAVYVDFVEYIPEATLLAWA